MSYEPTDWKTGDLISSIRLNKIENGIAAMYPHPQEAVIAPEQTVTITAETKPLIGEPITLADGYDLPVDIPEDWNVTVNGYSLRWNSTIENGGGYSSFATINGVFCVIMVRQIATSPMDSHIALSVFPDTSATETPTSVPGDYTVKITKSVPVKIPAVAAFPVVAGSGNVEWVIDAPKEDVDAAMANACVLLYSAEPNSRAGFSFGCLVGSVIYFAIGKDGLFSITGDSVSVRDGKYVVLGVA